MLMKANQRLMLGEGRDKAEREKYEEESST